MKYKTYPKYKDSGVEWIGKVPEGWGVKKLKFVAKERKEKNRSEEEACFIGLENIESWTGKLISSDSTDNTDGEALKFKKGDVLFSKLRPYLAKAFVAEKDGCCTSELIIYQPQDLDPSYLKYRLLSKDYIDLVNSLTYGVKMPRADPELLLNIKMQFPLPHEQSSIASFLDKKTAEIDSLIDKDRRLIGLLREKRSSLINHAVTKGLDPKASMKDSGVEWIGEIPEGWEVRKLSYCFDIIGSGTTPSSDDESYYMEGTIPWIITGDLNDSILEDASKRITESAFHEHSALKMFPKNSIIIAMYGATIGKLAITTFDACTNQACCVLTKSKIVDIKFLFYWFLANRNEIISRSYGGGQPNISQEVIRSLKIQVPPIQQQIAIVAYLDKQTTRINSTVSKIETKIALLLEYKKSLIHHAVTGAIMVPS